MGRIRRTAALGVVILATLATSGCVTLPDDGPVVPVEDQIRTQPDLGVERRAQPPQEGDPAQVIVNGFLQAMTAYPVRTDVARQYLASEIRDSWDPGGKIVTYESRDSATGSDVVKVGIQGANWVDRRGSWRGLRGSGDVELRFPMIVENGEYRIARARDEFVVTDDWFQDHYRPAAVYFLDQTASILVPEPIFVRSEQVAGSLIEALLDGPGTDVVRSFVPTGLTLGLSVPVSDDGQASIPLEGDVGALSPEAAKLMIYQFAWTLRQDPRVLTFSITLNDQPVTFAGGGTEFSIDLGSEYAPTDVQASSALFILRNGLLESGDADASTPVPGPLGQRQYGVEQVAVSLKGDLAASVSGAGSALQLSSVDDDSLAVVEVLSGATRLLKPAWDFAGRLWVVDRSDDGARVSMIDTTRDVTSATLVPVQGITGARVKRFLVSRDGTRLVAVVRGRRSDSLRVSRIRYDSLGHLRGVTPSRNLPWGGADGQRIRDIAWRSATSVGVLHQFTRSVAQFVAVPVDGSTGLDDRLTIPGRAQALVCSPVPDETLYIRTADGLGDPTGAEGGGTRPLPQVTSIQYVG
jgi:hypothetical protein